MASESDRRIQLRESIHELVVNAAARRCVTPAALVSMVVYDYLRTCGELDASPVSKAKSVTHVSKPKATYTPSVWDDDDDDDELANYKPDMLTPEEVLAEGIDLGGFNLDD